MDYDDLPGFNPLHCGAVVASWIRTVGGARQRRVSIPFIAGQWSLQYKGVLDMLEHYLFQSPSLRGSGRFEAERRAARLGGELVSIPFIAGQWSLHQLEALARLRSDAFQSPSLRGSGRFPPPLFPGWTI